MTDFKIKRIEYINNWPNAAKFDVEHQYEEKYKLVNNGIPFVPFRMTVNPDESYNKAVSFMIDAIESLERRPNHSFEFIFIAYDIYSKSVTSFDNITDRTQTLVHVWNTLIQSDADLNNSFNELFKYIPQKSLQYFFSRIFDSKIMTRATKDSNRRVDADRTNLLNQIHHKYSANYADYATGIRPGSRLIYHVFNKTSLVIDGVSHNISLEDKLHLLSSGFLYSLRNDTTHGSSISATKSSFTNMGTVANSYFAFLLTYYLLMLLIIEHTSSNRAQDLSDLARNMNLNLNNYIELFGHALSK